MKETILDSFSLKGKVALVTGASYGIGFASLQHLLKLVQQLSLMTSIQMLFQKEKKLIKKQVSMLKVMFVT